MQDKYVIRTEWKQTLIGKAPHVYLIVKENGVETELYDSHNPYQWTRYEWEYDDYEEAKKAFVELTNTKL